MRICAGPVGAALPFVYCPGYKPAQADAGRPKMDTSPTTRGRNPAVAYLEPTETVAQAPRFARHLIDKPRHVLDLTTRRTQLY